MIMPASKQAKLLRFAVYTLDEVLDHISLDLEEQVRFGEFDGQEIKLTSLRYRVFKKFGVKCVVCGIRGQFFAAEKHADTKRYHFNLYALDPKGNEVLMTKDHIKPKKEGGLDLLKNFQTMCVICNALKSDKSMEEVILNNWLVYILRCKDGTQYCGITNNLEQRLKKHNEGKAAKYTRSKKKRPAKLIATREGLTKRQALRLEYHVKKQAAFDKVSFLQTSKVHIEQR